MTNITVIIVNWHNASDTIDCVRSLELADAKSLHLTIILVDNASADASYRELEMFLNKKGCFAHSVKLSSEMSGMIWPCVKRWHIKDNLTVLLTSARKNEGFAGGNNIGVRLSQEISDTDFFWFLNSDTEIDPQALNHLVAKMKASSEIGMCGSTLLHASDRKTVQAYGGAFYSSRTGRAWAPGAGVPYDPSVSDEWAERRINYVSGAAMFVRSSLLKEIGLMAEEYFLYNEEIDLAVRATGRCTLGVSARSIVYHKIGATIGTEGGLDSSSRLSAFYQTRSKLIFAQKHYPIFYPSVWLALLARSVKLALRRHRRSEAKVMVQVLLGKRVVDPRWISERGGAIPSTFS